MQFGDRAFVETARRLMGDDEAWRAREIAAQDELLQIAAGKQPRAPVRSAAADVVACDKLACIG
jgi:hypothetical protein